jgi:hypothetical protein
VKPIGVIVMRNDDVPDRRHGILEKLNVPCRRRGAKQLSLLTMEYGQGIPLREDVTFALELCTNLLHFAGQVLQARPDPL